MSDVPMTAEAASPVVNAPAPEAEADIPNPIKVEPQKAEPKPEKPLSVRDTLARAREKVEKEEAGEKPLSDKVVKDQPKVPPKSANEANTAEKPADKVAEPQPRDNGRFTARETKAEEGEAKPAAQQPNAGGDDHQIAPKRYSQEARDAWTAVPDTVKAETYRMQRELEAGLNKHKETAARMEPFREFDDLARQSNVDSKAVLNEYVRLDRLINNPQTFVQGIEEILKGKGVSLQQFASAITQRNGQQPQPQNGQPQPTPQQPSREVTELKQTVALMSKQLEQVGQHIQTQQSEQHETILRDWSADKPHFDALRDRVTHLVSDEGLLPDDAYVKALTEAQDSARAFLGDTGVKPQPKTPVLSAEELAEQTRKGSRSIKGAPSAGSAPAAKQPSPTVRDALRRAFQQAG